jgi:hypothetical protein
VNESQTDAESITEGDDLVGAKEQSEAMAKAKLILEAVVASSAKENAGYLAMSAVSKIDNGKPVAIVTSMKGTDVRKVSPEME